MPRGRKPGSKNKSKVAMKKDSGKPEVKAVAKPSKSQPKEYKSTGKAVNKGGAVVIEQHNDGDTPSTGKSVVIRGGKAMLVNDADETGE